jgi:hypothetical protein
VERLQRLVAVGAGIGLLLAVWVSSASPLTTSLDRGTSAGPDDQSFNRGPDPVPPGVNAGRPPEVLDARGSAPEWLVTTIEWAFFVAIAAAVVTALAWLVMRLVDALRTAPPLPAVERQAPGVAATVLEGADERAADLQRGAATDSVIRCWLSLEQALARSGVPRDPARTPAETVQAALRAHDVDIAALDRLATLYRLARFSDHELTESDRAAAASALDQVHGDLRRLGAGRAVPRGGAAR